jgi:anti-anti-sigma factor
MSGLLRAMGRRDRTREDGPLTVQMEQAGDTLVVRATGELIRSTAKTFEAELRVAISGDASTVVLDLGGVGFIDSTGLRSVLRIANHSLRAGGRLRLRRASAPVQQALEWGGLEDLLPLVD